MRTLNIGLFAEFAAFAILSWPVHADEKLAGETVGKWLPTTFAQVNIGCVQAWKCTAPNGVIHSPGVEVVFTKDASSKGVCNAAGGPIDNCKACAASEPKQTCKYWLEKKKKR